MRILLLPGTYDLLNLGDLAMLEVCLERLRQVWPQVQVSVLTRRADLLLRHCPGVNPVSFKGRNQFLRIRALPFPFSAGIPHDREKFRLRFSRWGHAAALLWPPDLFRVRAFVQVLARSQAFMMCGCGTINDAFKHNALRVLDTFDLANDFGVPTLLTGQGIGPMADPELLRRSRQVLPRARKISVREPIHTVRWLAEAGVDPSRIQVTGDDAIELARRAGKPGLGQCLGVNLRAAGYAELNECFGTTISDALRSFATRRGCEIRHLPILTGSAPQADVPTFRRLFPDCTAAADRAAEIRSTARLAAEVAECRVVVTGSYHAGVFALSQGIPVIAVVSSDYYAEKFSGLAAQFGGEACYLLRPSQADLAGELQAKLERFWTGTEMLRPGLLQRADEQISLSREAYRSLHTVLAQAVEHAHP